MNLTILLAPKGKEKVEEEIELRTVYCPMSAVSAQLPNQLDNLYFTTNNLKMTHIYEKKCILFKTFLYY